MEQSSEKIAAIYDLREAVEKKVRLEQNLETKPKDQHARGLLLDATLNVEAKTQDAIEVCHECGREHVSTDAHYVSDGSNVIEVDFSGPNGNDKSAR